MDGEELGERKGPQAPAIIFYNQRGDECGGMLFYGKEEGDKVMAGSALLFDQFRNDQIFGMFYDEFDQKRSYGFIGGDRGDKPITEFVSRAQEVEAIESEEAKKVAMAKLQEEFPAFQRLFVGRSAEGEAIVSLMDTKGKPRLRMLVDSSDEPRIEFLDAEGNVTLQLPPSQGTRGA